MTVDVATVRQDVFTAIRALIISNKPTYTYNEETQTYSLVAEFPKENPTFPLIVLNKANISVVLLNLDGSGEDYAVIVQLDFYVKEEHGVKAVDVGQDGIGATLIGNISEFGTTDGLLPAEDFLDDSESVPFEVNNQLLNTASTIIKFILK